VLQKKSLLKEEKMGEFSLIQNVFIYFHSKKD